MVATSTNVVNEALNLIGYDGQAVTGVAPTFDSSTPGQIAANTYAAAVAATARMHGWEFTRTVAALSLSGNAAPFWWTYEYLFPANCAELWQVLYSMLTDLNNPTPVQWARGISVVANVQVSVIWTSVQNAQAVYNGNPLEQTWDSLFRATVVRYLASEFAAANLGKPDMVQAYFETMGGMLQLGMERADT